MQMTAAGTHIDKQIAPRERQGANSVSVPSRSLLAILNGRERD